MAAPPKKKNKNKNKKERKKNMKKGENMQGYTSIHIERTEDKVFILETFPFLDVFFQKK